MSNAPQSSDSELEEIINKYRILIADVADHGNDAKYQAFHHPTQYTRSNVNGYFGELEKAVLAHQKAQVEAAERAAYNAGLDDVLKELGVEDKNDTIYMYIRVRLNGLRKGEK